MVAFKFSEKGTLVEVVGFNPPAKTAAGFETHPTLRYKQKTRRPEGLRVREGKTIGDS